MATSKSSMENFDFNEIKKQMKELKEATNVKTKPDKNVFIFS